MFRKIRDGTQMNFIMSTLIRNSSLSEVRHNFRHLEMRRLRERRTAVKSTQQNTAESSLHTHTHVARVTTHPAFRKPASQCQKKLCKQKMLDNTQALLENTSSTQSTTLLSTGQDRRIQPQLPLILCATCAVPPLLRRHGNASGSPDAAESPRDVLPLPHLQQRPRAIACRGVLITFLLQLHSSGCEAVIQSVKLCRLDFRGPCCL